MIYFNFKYDVIRSGTAGLIQPGGGAIDCLLNLRFKEPSGLISYAFTIPFCFEQLNLTNLYI